MNRDKSLDNWEKDYSHRGQVWGGAVHYNLPIQSGETLLELGCGNGKTCSAILDQQCTVIGIDFSLSAVKMCRSRFSLKNNSDFAKADASFLPFRNESFDAIVAFHILGHLNENMRDQCVRETVRTLKDGGKIYFSGFSNEDFRAGTGKETEPGTYVKKNGISTHYFSEDEVIELFSGFTLIFCMTHRWDMRVKGQKYPRSEINASFVKKGRNAK